MYPVEKIKIKLFPQRMHLGKDKRAPQVAHLTIANIQMARMHLLRDRKRQWMSRFHFPTWNKAPTLLDSASLKRVFSAEPVSVRSRVVIT